MSRLLDWLSEECCGLLPLAYPTGGGDHDVIWTVIRYQMAEPCEVTIGQGRTAAAAIEDAMKDADDPTRWDYVPPQFRDEPRPAQETVLDPDEAVDISHLEPIYMVAGDPSSPIVGHRKNQG